MVFLLKTLAEIAALDYFQGLDKRAVHLIIHDAHIALKGISSVSKVEVQQLKLAMSMDLMAERVRKI